jgi:hypothetical protein
MEVPGISTEYFNHRLHPDGTVESLSGTLPWNQPRMPRRNYTRASEVEPLIQNPQQLIIGQLRRKCAGEAAYKAWFDWWGDFPPIGTAAVRSGLTDAPRGMPVRAHTVSPGFQRGDFGSDELEASH